MSARTHSLLLLSFPTALRRNRAALGRLGVAPKSVLLVSVACLCIFSIAYYRYGVCRLSSGGDRTSSVKFVIEKNRLPVLLPRLPMMADGQKLWQPIYCVFAFTLRKHSKLFTIMSGWLIAENILRHHLITRLVHLQKNNSLLPA